MRQNAFFGNAVHLFSTDLVFDRSARRADDRRMQALVAVSLRNGDKVFKAAIDGFVEFMQCSEC